MKEKINYNNHLSHDDIFIMKTQNYFIQCGFQWREQIYNDGFSNCYLVISRDDDPTVFETNPKNTMGWGRFGRRSCWEQALNYVDQIIER
jgi:hypothetical protein